MLKKLKKKEKKRQRKEEELGIKTFDSFEDDHLPMSTGFSYAKWAYMNPQVEQHGPIHSAYMEDDEDRGDVIHSASYQSDYET